MPGTNSTVPHEHGYVEQHVDCGLETVVCGLEPEPIVPSKDIPSNKAGEDVIGADKADGTNYEELEEADIISSSFDSGSVYVAYRESDSEHEKGLSIHIPSFFSPL